MILNVLWVPENTNFATGKETYLNFRVSCCFSFFRAEKSQSATDYHYLPFSQEDALVLFVSTFV
jgi:hypothetical protein